MKYFKYILIALIFLPGISVAAGNSGTHKISHLYQRSSDGLLGVYRKNGDWANPDNCQSSDRIVLKKDNNSRSEFYSAILASKISDRDFAAYLSGCIGWNGVTYPVITGVYTY